ncbi:thioredoxin [bacterium]|nr:thioredoxin [bacterium]
MADNVLAVTDSNFQAEVLNSSTPVLVDFWATWCGPCLRVAPIVEELANENDGKLKVVKLNVDEAGDTAGEYGVQSIPTLVIFKGGQEVDRIVGAVPKSTLQAAIDRNL